MVSAEQMQEVVGLAQKLYALERAIAKGSYMSVSFTAEQITNITTQRDNALAQLKTLVSGL